MKLHTILIAGIIAVALGIVGCSKKEAAVDTSSLEQSFAATEGAQKGAVDTAVAAVKRADYPAAAAELQKLAADVQLTPEQQQAVKDVLAQVQKAVTDAAGQAATEGSKAIGDLQQSLPR